MKEDIKIVVYYNTHTRRFEIVEAAAQNVFDAVHFREAVKHRDDMNEFFKEDCQ